MSGGVLPLVMVPGYMLDETLWEALRPTLSVPAAAAAAAAAPAGGPEAGRRELRHVPLAGGANIAQMAQAALAACPEGRFDLLGFSMGGYVAREMARIAPQRVRSLLLIATSSRADTPLQISQRQKAAQANPLGPFRGLGRAAIIQSLHPDHAADLALIERVRGMGERLGRAAFIEQSMIVRDSDAAQLSAIACPTLVIAAAQDQMRSADEAHELAAGIPGAQLHTIEHSGHMIPLEQPAQLAQHLASWLDSLSRNPNV